MLRACLSLLAVLCGTAFAFAQAAPPLPGSAPAPGDTAKTRVTLSAVFGGEGKPVRSGLMWRVFEERADAAPPALVEKSTTAAPTFALKPGNYFVHATYGFA